MRREVKVSAVAPTPSPRFVDLLLGISLLATIGFAATSPLLATREPSRRLTGWLLVAIPLPLAVGFRLSAPSWPVGGESAFVVGVLAFAVGALLVLSGRGHGEDDRREADDVPPPWWPEFETEFRAYACRHSRRRVRA